MGDALGEGESVDVWVGVGVKVLVPVTGVAVMVPVIADYGADALLFTLMRKLTRRWSQARASWRGCPWPEWWILRRSGSSYPALF